MLLPNTKKLSLPNKVSHLMCRRRSCWVAAQPEFIAKTQRAREKENSRLAILRPISFVNVSLPFLVHHHSEILRSAFASAMERQRRQRRRKKLLNKSQNQIKLLCDQSASTEENLFDRIYDCDLLLLLSLDENLMSYELWSVFNDFNMKLIWVMSFLKGWQSTHCDTKFSRFKADSGECSRQTGEKRRKKSTHNTKKRLKSIR